jgi:transcriptional regulator with XRE-family HTH domain
MKRAQNPATPPELLQTLRDLGTRIARMRLARSLIQADCAIRANLSRETASRIERGDPSVAVGQIIRYLDAIAAGMTLQLLYTTVDPAVELLAHEERRKRARRLSETELQRHDF